MRNPLLPCVRLDGTRTTDQVTVYLELLPQPVGESVPGYVLVSLYLPIPAVQVSKVAPVTATWSIATGPSQSTVNRSTKNFSAQAPAVAQIPPIADIRLANSSAPR